MSRHSDFPSCPTCLNGRLHKGFELSDSNQILKTKRQLADAARLGATSVYLVPGLDGGATALGHPLGATGARITGKAAQLLKREGKKFALSTQCIGGGQGITTILEAV